MNYGTLIRDALFVALRNRFLWVFGFFIGGGTPFVTPSNFGTGGFEAGQEPPPWVSELIRWIEENVALFVVSAIVLVLLVLVIAVTLATICRGGLVESVAAIERGEERRFSSTLRAGLSNFWRVLGQGVLFFLIWLGFILALYIVGMLLVFGTLALTDSTAARVLVIGFGILLLVLLFIAFLIPLTIISQLALRELVIGREGVLDSIGGGYRLFRQNPGRSLVLLLIQIALAFGVGVVLVILTNLVGLLLYVPVALLAPSGVTAASIVVGVVLSLIFSIPFAVLSGAIGAFYQAYWTLAYLRLSTPPEEAASRT